jgi:putative transposase
VLADKKGVPLSIVITAANTHDMKATAETLDCIVTKRPPPPKKKKQQQQNLCLDKGYNYPEIEQEVVKRGYMYRISVREVKGKNQLRKEDIIHQEDGL